MYVANRQNGCVQIWLEGSTSPTRTIFSNSSDSFYLVLSKLGDIFISRGGSFNRVDVWQDSTGTYQSTLIVGGSCWALFIDTNDSLYCSMDNSHKVIKRSLSSSDNQTSIVAGTGCIGYQPYALDDPSGIFVSINFDLYVADTGNDRIQVFGIGQMVATTAAGREAAGTIELRGPTGVILDGDGYLFITDCINRRIVRSGSAGFWCVIGCTDQGGSESNRLNRPQIMAFDRYGNIFVADTKNHRVLKFILSFNSCSK